MKKILFYDEFSALDDFFYNWNSSEIKSKKNKLVNLYNWRNYCWLMYPKSMTQKTVKEYNGQLISLRDVFFYYRTFLLKEIELKFEIPAT